MDYRNHVRTTHLGLTASEVLQAKPSILIGVGPEAEAALVLLRVESVYDLALSTVFANARLIVEAATHSDAIIRKHGFAPSDVIDQASRSIPLEALPSAPISALIGIGPNTTLTLAPALGVHTIRDLAFWPPYAAARRVFSHVLQPEAVEGADPEAPADLRPRDDSFATQRVAYSTTVLLETRSRHREWNGSPIDSTSLDAVGFDDVAFGAVLHFSQRWRPRAVALGQLLHSLPLAPGESTKVSILDWVRRSSSSASEDVQQQESLAASMEQATAITEVTNAVAKETQQGSSVSGSASSSTSAGGIGFIPSFGFAGGGASSNASGAASYTVSRGDRAISAQSVQDIAARTQQRSSLARNRRAAVVSEVSDAESESIRTRQLTNHNHMHAMTVHYFEVIQVYETEVRLDRIERCMFIPMALVNLRTEVNIRRFLPILVARAKDRELRDMLRAFAATVVVTLGMDRFLADELRDLEKLLWNQVATAAPGIAIPSTAPGAFPLSDAREKAIVIGDLRKQARVLRDAVRANYEGARAKRLVVDFDRKDLGSLTLGSHVTIDGASWREDDGVSGVRLHLVDGDVVDLPDLEMKDTATGWLAPGIAAERIRSVSVRLAASGKANPSDFALRHVNLHLRTNDRSHWLDLSFVASMRMTEVTLLTMQPPVALRAIADRLMEDQLYYSQQIWLNADRHTLLMQLVPKVYSFSPTERVRVVDYLDPVPVTVAGNYVAFRFTYENDAAWKAWKAQQLAAAVQRTDLVPMATGGVFAEAVLGEFNSAEKLDTTRFWRWQDSPIPHMAPDIAPVDAGMRQVATPATSRALSAPALALSPPMALPALGATEQALRAVVANTIFRDMGGLDITSKLLAASLEAARRGDEAGAKQARQVAEAAMAALAQVMTTIGQASRQGAKTATEMGGVVNVLTGGGTGGLGALINAIPR